MQKFACSWTHAVQNHVGQGSTVYVEVDMEYMYFYFVFFKEQLEIFKLKDCRDKAVDNHLLENKSQTKIS